MKTYVVDASVMLKWILGDKQDPDHAKALGLLDAWINGMADLSAPILWQYEVGNFLGRELGQDAAGKMDILLNLNIRTVDLNGSIYRRCFDWMRQNEVTFYDACYLAVAFEIQATLITADERFVKKMGKTGRICLVKDLDFGSGGIRS